MEAIHCQYPFFPTRSLLIKHPTPSQKTQLVNPLTTGGPPPPLRSPLHNRPQAINSTSLGLAVDSPASSGDISVLITISTLLLFVYWISNFVVPDMISKDFPSEKPNEEMPEESTSPLGGKETSMPSRGKGSGRKSSRL